MKMVAHEKAEQVNRGRAKKKCDDPREKQSQKKSKQRHNNNNNNIKLCDNGNCC